MTFVKYMGIGALGMLVLVALWMTVYAVSTGIGIHFWPL